MRRKRSEIAGFIVGLAICTIAFILNLMIGAALTPSLGVLGGAIAVIVSLAIGGLGILVILFFWNIFNDFESSSVIQK